MLGLTNLQYIYNTKWAIERLKSDDHNLIWFPRTESLFGNLLCDSYCFAVTQSIFLAHFNSKIQNQLVKICFLFFSHIWSIRHLRWLTMTNFKHDLRNYFSPEVVWIRKWIIKLFICFSSSKLIDQILKDRKTVRLEMRGRHVKWKQNKKSSFSCQ